MIMKFAPVGNATSLATKLSVVIHVGASTNCGKAGHFRTDCPFEPMSQLCGSSDHFSQEDAQSERDSDNEESMDDSQPEATLQSSQPSNSEEHQTDEGTEVVTVINCYKHLL